MNDTVLIALIVSAAPFIAACGSWRASLKNAKKLDEVHKSTNGMKDALVEAAHDAGMIAGRASQKSDDVSMVAAASLQDARLDAAHKAGVTEGRADQKSDDRKKG